MQGFRLDGDPRRRRGRVATDHGHADPVEGALEALESVLTKHNADEVVVSSRSIAGPREQRAREIVERTGRRLRRLRIEID